MTSKCYAELSEQLEEKNQRFLECKRTTTESFSWSKVHCPQKCIGKKKTEWFWSSNCWKIHLEPFGVCLFSNIRKLVTVIRLESNEEVIVALNWVFYTTFSQSHNKKGENQTRETLDKVHRSNKRLISFYHLERLSPCRRRTFHHAFTDIVSANQSKITAITTNKHRHPYGLNLSLIQRQLLWRAGRETVEKRFTVANVTVYTREKHVSALRMLRIYDSLN